MNDAQILNAIHNKLGDNTLLIRYLGGMWHITLENDEDVVKCSRDSFRECMSEVATYLKSK